MNEISPLVAGASQYTPQSQANLAAAGNDKIDEVSKDFESVFLSQMMSQMFSGEDVNNFFGGGSTGEIYKGFLMEEYGKAMAKAGGVGIASQVKGELLRLQEVTQ